MAGLVLHVRRSSLSVFKKSVLFVFSDAVKNAYVTPLVVSFSISKVIHLGEAE